MCTRESEQHQQQHHTAAAAAVGAEAADGPWRNCGTAAAVSTAAVIWQEGHTYWLGELKTTDSRFFILRNVRRRHQQQRQQHSSYTTHTKNNYIKHAKAEQNTKNSTDRSTETHLATYLRSQRMQRNL